MINLLASKKSWHIPEKKRARKNRIPFLVLLTFFVLIFEVALLQAGALGVSAQIAPSGSPDHLNFGLVFPSERLSQFFKVFINENPSEKLEYYILQYPKPQPEYVAQTSTVVAQQYCRANPQNLELCYPDLCAHLTKTITDPAETDTEQQAFLSPGDLTDLWEVELVVPAIESYVAQAHQEGKIKEAGEYGCDISINFRVNGGTNAVNDGAGGNIFKEVSDEDQGKTGTQGAFTIASSPLQMILPASLPKAGEWSIILSLALVGFAVIVLIWRKNKN